MKFQATFLASVVLLFLAPQINAACTESYKTVKGDTCLKIKAEFKLTKRQFKSLNPNINCSRSPLKTGENICVSSSGCKSYYAVAPGDNCDLIAHNNNESHERIVKDNPGIFCPSLAVGDAICIGYGKGTLRRIPIPDRHCTVKGTFAITFDDGPFDYTEGLLDFLKTHNLKSTFFINGQNFGNIYNHSKTLKRIYNEGHHIAHHTWSHADISILTEEKLREEITKLEVAFRAIIGVIPTFFRPPYGNTNPQSLKVLQELGYRVIKWDVSNDDTVGLVNEKNKTLEQGQAAFKSTLNISGIHPAKDGHISLSHDPLEITAQKFAPWAFDYVKSLGYKIQTVGECLGVPNSADWYRK